MAGTAVSEHLMTKNKLLSCLPEEERRKLLAHVVFYHFQYQQTVFGTGDLVRNVFFPLDCVVAEVAIMNDGSTVETGMIGPEGAVGITSAFGEYRAWSWKRTLIAGAALAASSDTLQTMFESSAPLHRLMLDYYRTRIIHVSRRAVCNARHLLGERVCTWLLTVQDRMPSTDDIPLTQEAVAREMGARRAGVNEILMALQSSDVVGHTRGHIQILDRDKLETMACVCYRGFKTEIDWCTESARSV